MFQAFKGVKELAAKPVEEFTDKDVRTVTMRPLLASQWSDSTHQSAVPIIYPTQQGLAVLASFKEFATRSVKAMAMVADPEKYVELLGKYSDLADGEVEPANERESMMKQLMDAVQTGDREAARKFHDMVAGDIWGDGALGGWTLYGVDCMIDWRPCTHSMVVSSTSRRLMHTTPHAHPYAALDLKEFGSDGTEPATIKQLRELAMSDPDMWDLITGSDPLAKEYVDGLCGCRGRLWDALVLTLHTLHATPHPIQTGCWPTPRSSSTLARTTRRRALKYRQTMVTVKLAPRQGIDLK